jgi:hypothetical protein
MIKRGRNRAYCVVSVAHLSLDNRLSLFWAIKQYGYLLPENCTVSFVEYGALVRDYLSKHNFAGSEGYFNLFQEAMRNDE